MFCGEIDRHYGACKGKSEIAPMRARFLQQSNHQVNRNDFVILCPAKSNSYCHSEESLITDIPMTTATPTPAPRKSRGQAVSAVAAAAASFVAANRAKRNQFVAFNSNSVHNSICQSRAQLYEKISSLHQAQQRSQSLMKKQQPHNCFTIGNNNSNNQTSYQNKADSFGHSKLSRNNAIVLTKSDKTSESSTREEDDDTEDSSDKKLDKPKPGKLDLSQFDNITNAIGKLKVQNTAKVPESTHSKVSSNQEASGTQQESGLFKSRSKKTSKSRTNKEIKGQLSSTTTATETPTVATSTQSSSTSFATTNFASGSAGPSGPNSAKRLGNPRQNHGRAVAPPQLPEGSNILGGSSTTKPSDSGIKLAAATSYNENQQPVNESFSRLMSHETTRQPDFSQSPIAQRLLKHSKDHKGIDFRSRQSANESQLQLDQVTYPLVSTSPHPLQLVSELNSPFGSDTELSQSIDSSGSQRMHLGQSFGLEGCFSGQQQMFASSSIDSSDLINARGAAIRQLNEILSSKQPSGRPGLSAGPVSRGSSIDQDLEQQSSKKSDKNNKKDKKLRDYEKSEKRRLKEEERQRSKEKKLAAKKSKLNAASGDGSVGDDGIPLFIRRCIEFIEDEGLEAEGIYRVPGNRAHVDAFVQKFKENPDLLIDESDVPVNAVATALKDFLSKKWGPIVPLDLMNELGELSSIPEKGQRVVAVRKLIHRLPPPNYNLLKYVISHFVKVSMNYSLNSMDSKNLAICWWPTLLPLHFSDMVMFEQMRPHLEESVQTMIDQYDFIFDTETPDSSATP